MSTQEGSAYLDLFWRNPYQYWRQMKELNETDIAWDRGILDKMKIDPFLFSNIKFTAMNPNWRAYVVGKHDTQEYNAGCRSERPFASYPTFDWAQDDIEVLEFYLKNPWGEDPTMYNDTSVEIKDRAVKGQPHKVFVTNIPDLRTIEGRQAIALLEQINNNWKPYCTIFVHRLTGFMDIFGRGFTSASFDGRERASHGRIQLHNGKIFDPRYIEPTKVEPFLAMFGFKFRDMEIASNRCLFNMMSARYASMHFEKEGRPLARLGNYNPDPTLPDTEAVYPSAKKA